MAGLELLWEVEGYDLGFDQHQVQQEQRLLVHTQIGVTRQFVLLGRPGMSKAEDHQQEAATASSQDAEWANQFLNQASQVLM